MKRSVRKTDDIDGLVKITDAGRELNLDPEGLKRRITDHGGTLYRYRRSLYCKPEALEAYLQHREKRAPHANTRPKGWLPSKVVTEELRINITALHAMLQRGKIVGVRVGKMYFFCPESVRHTRLKREAPLVGWVAITDLAQETGVSYKTVHRFVDRQAYPVRTYYVPSGGQGKGQRPTRKSIPEWAADEVRLRYAIKQQRAA